MLFRYLERKRRERQIKRGVDSATKLAVGATVGGVLGILFAPKSGKETRKEIKDKSIDTATKVKNVTEEKYVELKNNLSDDYKLAKETKKIVVENVKEGYEDIKEDYREAKEEIKGEVLVIDNEDNKEEED